MPLIRIDEVSHGIRVGLWRMDEAIEALPKPQGTCLDGIRSAVRLREQLTTYCLLEAMTGRSDIVVGHTQSGKPFVDGMEISLSHTKGWAAMILSDYHCVGIDIEYVSERVNRVASRFIRPDEESETLAKRLITWSAKETVYKLLSSENLQFFDMRLGHIADSCKGVVTVEDLQQGGTVEVSYILNDDFVLTWAER